jgi:hypothetical protein
LDISLAEILTTTTCIFVSKRGVSIPGASTSKVVDFNSKFHATWRLTTDTSISSAAQVFGSGRGLATSACIYGWLL